MQDYSHHLPGRLRLRFTQLKSRPAHAAQLTAALGRIDGVVSIDANVVTGGLLIIYDVARADANGLWEALRDVLATHGLSGTAERPLTQANRSAAAAVTERLADKVVGALVEKLVERSALALVATLL
jgi:hypothetical protein